MTKSLSTYNALNGEELLRISFQKAFEQFSAHSIFRPHLAYHNPVIRFTIEVCAVDNSEGFKNPVPFSLSLRSEESVSIPTDSDINTAPNVKETLVYCSEEEIRFPDKERFDQGMPIPTPQMTGQGIVDVPIVKQPPKPVSKPVKNRASNQKVEK